MSEVALPPFPVDEITLTAIKHSLGCGYEVDADGTHTLVGADFTLSSLLEFYSGYDPAKLEVIRTDPLGEPEWLEYPDVTYHVNDVVAALIAEVERLRAVVR